jgi:hypothetical protein
MLRRYHDDVADAEYHTPKGDAPSSTDDIGNEASNKGTDQSTD